jgi:hypothetical protein
MRVVTTGNLSLGNRPALQQHARSPPAPSGRRALRGPHTGATQLSGSTLQQHVCSPAHSGQHAKRAPLTSGLTQTITTPVVRPGHKLAYSPIIVANLKNESGRKKRTNKNA